MIGHIETRTQGRSTEPHCGAAPWVTLTDVFGLVAGVTPVREPTIWGQPILPIRTSKLNSILS